MMASTSTSPNINNNNNHNSNHKRPSIASVIQEKRRLASLSIQFTNQKSNHKSSSGSTTPSNHPPLSPSSPLIPNQHHTRSRGGTRIGGLSDLTGTTRFDSLNRAFNRFTWDTQSNRSIPITLNTNNIITDEPSTSDHLQHNISGVGEVVMTPTTEEWRSLGGLPGDMKKFKNDIISSNIVAMDDEDDDAGDDSDNSAGTNNSLEEAIRILPKSTIIEDLPDSPIKSTSSNRKRSTSIPIQTRSYRSITPISTNTFSSQQPATPDQFPTALVPSDVEPTVALPTLTSVNGIIHNTDHSIPTLSALSSQSLGISSPSSLLASFLDPLPAIRPCSLSHDGIVRKSIDPRSYSAITGYRNIQSFVIEGESGKGAYGVVKKVREISAGSDGPPLIVKYIIKQKILADCWKSHKVLGPIPIEIHVLDHLRRVSYRPSIVGSTTTTNSTTTTTTEQRTGHPNICGILDYFEDPDYYYLVMPYFGEGQDLFDYIESFPNGLDLNNVIVIFQQILDAVCFLHERNIVHRDIKDENVILDSSGNVQLIDFGSAAYVKEGKKFDTFSGTLDFAAPEVLKGERHGGKEIDIWALGVLLYVLLCGECPFWNANEALEGIEIGTRAFNGLVGKDPVVVEVLKSCLELDPSKRVTAHQLATHRLFSR
ncbi:hypothetical protein CROQUDRAFT_666825 [Cronartium quercuum f. sp. fusiforme G11]|uniref:Protein kinase domain-containing protein n=1 Tax=Cronartium quercuum f. sp. fusiforme G11 TaxID=708437 RepID=A0A9P6N844_9BASI|nr:hypothetical protein CROQUDRAFT_666825 [Cronartium quercuum f. sp. fusiforme G11]